MLKVTVPVVCFSYSIEWKLRNRYFSGRITQVQFRYIHSMFMTKAHWRNSKAHHCSELHCSICTFLCFEIQGWGFCGFFRIYEFFISSYNLPHFCGFLQFRSFLTLIREREMQKKNACKITLTEPQREMQKNCSQKISLTEPQLREPLNCERHAQCTLSFC